MRVLICLLVLIALFSSTYAETAVEPKNRELYKAFDKFGSVLEAVRNNYVHKPNDEQLIQWAIDAMLSKLDPYSRYINAREYNAMLKQARDKPAGLGLEITKSNKLVKIVGITANSPAEKSKIRAGDTITHIDKKKVNTLKLKEVAEKMRGKVNTPVTLTLIRKGKTKPFSIKLTRKKINPYPVHALLISDIGYIRISGFSAYTTSGLKRMVKQIQKQRGSKLKGYILDLRNNSGGLLEQVISVTDNFLEKGIIVLTQGRNKKEINRSVAKKGDIIKGKPLIILINANSAAGTEILASALQDNKRAKLIGTKSFGQGTIQTTIPLGKNGVLQLTTAKIYRPSGDPISKQGITPDYVIRNDIPTNSQIKSQKEKNKASKTYVPKDIRKDLQLQFAITLLSTFIATEKQK